MGRQGMHVEFWWETSW